MKQLSTYLFIAILTGIASLLGYNYFFQPFYQEQATTPTPTASQSAELVSQTRLEKLPVKAKLAQLLALQLTIGDPLVISSASGRLTTNTLNPETLMELQEIRPGAVVLVGEYQASEAARMKVVELQSTADPEWPLIVGVNQHTDRRLTSQSQFMRTPLTMAQACARNVDSATQQWLGVAKDWQVIGFGMVLGPVVDMPHKNAYIKKMACDDPEKTLNLARAFISGFGQQAIVPVMAHFPGIGQATSNPQVTAQELIIALKDLEPFSQLLDNYTNVGVLTSAVRVAEKFGGVPCSLSQECLASFTARYPKTFLVADALGNDLAKTLKLSLGEMVVQAVMAGNQLVILDEAVSFAEIRDVLAVMEARYYENPAFASKVDVAVARIEILKQVKPLSLPAHPESKTPQAPE